MFEKNLPAIYVMTVIMSLPINPYWKRTCTRAFGTCICEKHGYIATKKKSDFFSFLFWKLFNRLDLLIGTTRLQAWLFQAAFGLSFNSNRWRWNGFAVMFVFEIFCMLSPRDKPPKNIMPLSCGWLFVWLGLEVAKEFIEPLNVPQSSVNPTVSWNGLSILILQSAEIWTSPH